MTRIPLFMALGAATSPAFLAEDGGPVITRIRQGLLERCAPVSRGP